MSKLDDFYDLPHRLQPTVGSGEVTPSQKETGDFSYLLYRLQSTMGSSQRQFRLHVFELLLQFDLLPDLRRRIRALQRTLDGLHG